MLDKPTKDMLRYLCLMVVILISALVVVSFMGCATTPNNPNNDKIIASLDSIFDTYELVRITQDKNTVTWLIVNHPEEVALWMAGVEAAIISIEAAGGDLELLVRLQTEFKQRFGVPMKVPVV